jgi:hypothetical protein
LIVLSTKKASMKMFHCNFFILIMCEFFVMIKMLISEWDYFEFFYANICLLEMSQ